MTRPLDLGGGRSESETTQTSAHRCSLSLFLSGLAASATWRGIGQTPCKATTVEMSILFLPK